MALDRVHPKALAMQRPQGPFVERRDLMRREALRRRVIAEFDEMPGLRLTFWQATRLFGISEGACDRLLAQLITDGILCRSGSGAYSRRESQ
jgi:hypothetical protein